MTGERGQEDAGNSAAAFLKAVRPFSILPDAEIGRISERASAKDIFT